MARQGFKVPPRGSDNIRQVATDFRSLLGLDRAVWIPVLQVAEYILPHGVQVLDANEMGEEEGRSYPDQYRMELRSDVYDAASEDEPRARFTVAHELGHIFLHQGVSFAFSRSNAILRPYENSEWQADEFAGLFLAPTEIIRGWNASKIASECGMSITAAAVRMNKTKNR